MTKKDYIEIARLIKFRVEYNKTFEDSEFKSGCLDELTKISKSLSIIFQSDNPRFNREKFLTACGVTSGTK